ncbi:hypothetical protein [Methylovulum psychrotolerans]|jgi:hypothetical protein|uniref:Uncharacterized protein n=1 Tax=Methylovulum psychrotolerans TaxID=1704499 RepID=A0A2S5CI93_9GAMM|nr:hypothetical protein [Methylovulum psychrotolerans]MBT9097383.1 hypothetical protein [Methylovulum psychrotolerans]POZ50509.1 hypothetical protein AADEFJLK_03705 [Methylovulum psychrotolerans]
MPRKIHMHDQVYNKIDGIMNHYKKRPMQGFMRRLIKLIRRPSMAA